ncbi:positive regulator AgmR [Vibrio cholerae]|nr:positive regulator AgmR [Vibrio cholerae]TQP92318.1 positive regulator AgmR [Vibrio cholerae]
MKLLNFRRFLPRKYSIETQRPIHELSKYEADFSRTIELKILMILTSRS